MSNMGSIILSLSPTTHPVEGLSIDTVTSHQVRLLSISNTAARMILGSLADFVSPVIPSQPTSEAQRRRLNRVVFLSGPALLLASTFFWMELRVKTPEAAWVLSIGTGICYGGIFAVLPGIISSVWGLPDLGRNFGMITYSPFIGTPLFSYLYAFVSDSMSDGQTICKGVQCWQLTFWVSFTTSLFAFGISVILWKRWNGRV